MRFLRGFFIALAVLFAVAAIAVAGLLSPYGLRAVSDDLASWASARLGRALRIDGELQIEVGRRITVSATGVHLANAAWGRRPDMLTADRVHIEIDALSVLSHGTVVITQIDVAGLDLLLERTDEGDENWQFDTSGDALDSDDEPWLTSLPYIVDRVDMPAAHVQFIGPRLDRPLDLRFNELRQQRGAADMLELTATGRANDVDLTLSGRIGPFTNLLAAKAFNVSVDGHLGEMSLSVNARIDNLAQPIDSEINVDLHAPDAGYVAATLGVRNLGTGPFTLALSISPALDGKGVRGSIVGRVGEFDIAGDGELDEPTRMGKLTLRTEISGPDVSLLGGLIGVDRLPAERFRLTATIQRHESLLLIDAADLELPDSALHLKGSIKRLDNHTGNDLTMHISGANIEKFRALLRIPGIATGPFELTGTVHPSGAATDVIDLTVKTAFATISAAGQLGAYPDFDNTRLDVTLSGNDFGRVAPFFGLRAPNSGAFSGRGRLEWTSAGLALRSATLETREGALNLDGQLGNTSSPAGDVRFGVRGKSLAAFADLAGWTGLPPQPYALEGSLSWKSGRTRFDDVDLTAAGARLSLSGTLGPPPRWHGTALSFVVNGPDLGAFAGLAQGVALPTGPFRARGALAIANDRVQLRNVSATVAGADATISTDTILPLDAAVRTSANRFDIRAKGPDLKTLIPDLPDVSAAHQKFDLDARGSWTAERSTFDALRLDTPTGFVHVQGTLDRAPDYSATAMNAEVRIADLRQTGALFDIDLPAGALDASATVSGTATAFRMDPLKGRFGDSDFAGHVGLDLTAKPVLDVELRSEVLDLTPFTSNAATTPTTVTADTRRIPDFTLPLALLDRIDGRAAVSSAATRFFGATYADLNLHAELKDGQLTIDPLAFGSADGNLNARFVVGPVAASPNVSLAVSGDNIALSVIPGMNETAAASRYRMQVDVAASGDNLRSLAATLNGRMRFVGAGARVPNSRMNALSSDFMGQLLRTLNPMAKRQEFTDVVCQAYLFRIKAGVLSTDPALVIRTTDIDVVSNGTLNLTTEAVDFNFKTAARKGLGFSAGEFLNPYVKVTGTFAKPRLTVDPKGTLVNGGAAFATGGLSILATTLWDRISREKDPCAAAVAESDRRAAKP